jgi:hypothetical protein
LARFLCTNCREKDPMPFTKVVEQCKIYNFVIQRFAYFNSKILRKPLLNKPTPNCLALERVGTRARTMSRSAMSASRPYAAVRARRGRPTTVGPSAASKRSCAWYYGPQIRATRCACMRRPAAPPLSIGPSRRPQATIGHLRSHRLCPMSRPTVRRLS